MEKRSPNSRSLRMDWLDAGRRIGDFGTETGTWGTAGAERVMPRREFLGLTGRIIVTATGVTLVASSERAFGGAAATGCGAGWPTQINTCNASNPNNCSVTDPHVCTGPNAKNNCAGMQWANRCVGNGANTCKSGAQNICQGPAETNECRGASHPGGANRCNGTTGGPANECHGGKHANKCDPAFSGNKCTGGSPGSPSNQCYGNPMGSADNTEEE